jgi:hypothetical protein
MTDEPTSEHYIYYQSPVKGDNSRVNRERHADFKEVTSE